MEGSHGTDPGRASGRTDSRNQDGAQEPSARCLQPARGGGWSGRAERVSRRPGGALPSAGLHGKEPLTEEIKPRGFWIKLALKKGVTSGKSSEESKINSRSARPGGMQRIRGEMRPGQAETPRAHLTQPSPPGRPRRAGKSPGHSEGPGQRGACRPGVLSRSGRFLL